MKKKKKRAEPPKDFEVEDAEEAFRKMEDAAHRLFAAPKPKPQTRKKRK